MNITLVFAINYTSLLRSRALRPVSIRNPGPSKVRLLVLGILCSGSASVCLCASVYCVCVITGAQTFLNLVVGICSTPSTDCTPYISVPPFCIAGVGSAFHIKRERESVSVVGGKGLARTD